MALEYLKSTQITNRDATPAVLNSPVTEAAVLREKVAIIAPSASASISATYRMVDIPSNARVAEVLFASEAMTAGKFDIGVYRNTRDGGAVVDQDFFGSAVDCSAAVAMTDVTNESGQNSLTEQTQQLWQAVGLSTDPKSTLDIVLTATSAVTASATCVLKVKYVV
jgi:hypothetical protein